MCSISKEIKEIQFPTPPRYIIFDMDGVIFDTPRIYFEVHQEMAKAISDYRFTIADQRALLLKKETSKRSSLEIFLEIIGFPPIHFTNSDLEELETIRFSMARKKIKTQNLARPGVGELVNWLSSHGRIVCLATKSRSDFVTFLFENNQEILLSKFDLVVTRSDLTNYKRTKTDINRLLLARIENLVGKEIDREQCLIFEDSPHGISAAKEAGIGVVIAVPDGISWDFEQSHQVFSSADFVAQDLISVLVNWKKSDSS